MQIEQLLVICQTNERKDMQTGSSIAHRSLLGQVCSESSEVTGCLRLDLIFDIDRCSECPEHWDDYTDGKV